MISRELAVALKRAGLEWHPTSGDRFQLDLPDQTEHEFESQVFTVSEMTIESHRTPSGATILGFNGTTEWALDSLSLGDAVWLPREDQLRDLLRNTFQALRRLDDAFEVELELAGERRRFEHPDPAEAYGLGLLDLIERSR
ncbi:pilus assembly protein CpaE [Agromyces aerolatus]|uniref:pilus assembly protein CpaE n=1 Tax=Agromyces sp. LY-1074 TaxID=3074080 RepID=UPI00285B8077|nr:MULTISPECIES: pilus assembly protein CpaE [unclassified Agromyces]MDR5698761.1 pilus assembly protein CpaE [Agromyces sp. LY-1074]MDR5705055.1 pilus assembly protein CpaE [Agromyces sp. LY-1358]